MKRRNFLTGSIFAGAGAILGGKVIEAPKTVTPAPEVPETATATYATYNVPPVNYGPFSLMNAEEISEFRTQQAMERIRQSPWYRDYIDQKVTGHLEVPREKLITTRYVLYPKGAEST